MERTAVSSWVSRLLGLATVAAMAGTGGVAPARACTCPGVPPLPRALEQSDAVFLGMAVAIELLPPSTPPAWDRREIGPAGWWNDEEKILAPSSWTSRRYFERRVTFVIDAAWKGVAGESVTVITNSGGAASCGLDFTLGAEYLVYTFGIESTGEHWVSSCSRTATLFEAREDLEVLPPPAVDYAARRHRRDAVVTDGRLPGLFGPSGWCGVAWCDYDSGGEQAAAGTEAGGERSGVP